MSFLKGMKDKVGQIGSSLGSGIFGDSDEAGILGVGQFKAGQYGYDPKAFERTKASDAARKSFKQQLDEVNQRTAPTSKAATIDQSQQAQFRGAQSRLLGQLEAQAAGRGPSLAQSQLRQATDRNIAQQMAMAASGRGRTAGQGMRAAQMGAAAANQQAAAQAADLRMQEQMVARQQLAGVADSARSQDIGLAQNQAALNQQTALANQQAVLANRAQQDAMRQFYNQGIVGLNQYDDQRLMALEQLRGQQFQAAQGVNYSGYESASNRRAGFLAGLGEVMNISDEEQKQGIVSGQSRAKSFLDSLSAMAKSENQSRAETSPDAELYRDISGKGPQMSVARGPEDIKAPETPEPKQAVKAETQSVAQLPDMQNGISTGAAQKRHGKAIGQMVQKAVMASDFNQKIDITPVSVPEHPISSGDVFRKDKGGSGKGFDFSSLASLFSEGGGAAAAASDKKVKTDMKQPGDERLSRFIDALKAYEYEYKNPEMPGAGEGRFVSPMAQDIEKTELGKGMVEDTPQGKMVNYGKAGGLMLATAAMLNDRLNEIEAKMGDVFKKRQTKAG